MVCVAIWLLASFQFSPIMNTFHYLVLKIRVTKGDSRHTITLKYLPMQTRLSGGAMEITVIHSKQQFISR